MWRILSNFVLSLRRISLPKSLCKISFSRTSPKAEMVLLRRHKKFKTTSQFSGFRLSNINPRSPTAKPTTTLSNPSVRRIEHPSLAMATLVKSSDLPTLSIRLIMQGKVTEKLGDPTNTMIPPFSLSTPTQPFFPTNNPTLDLGLCLVKPEMVWRQCCTPNNNQPFDHSPSYSSSRCHLCFQQNTTLLFWSLHCAFLKQTTLSMFNLVSDTNSLFSEPSGQLVSDILCITFQL